VPVLRDGDVCVYETGAVLLYLVERLPGAGLGPLPGERGRGELLRWILWLADTLHGAYVPMDAPRFLTDDPAGYGGIGRRGREQLAAHGAYLEGELAGRTWCLGAAFSVADLYLYMLKGWDSYGDSVLGGGSLAGHYARVGARPAVKRTRELDDLDERLQRHHPGLRGGKPIA
jgi:glutathione S-transferase